MIGVIAMISGNSRSALSLKVKRTLRSPIFSSLAILLHAVAVGRAALLGEDLVGEEHVLGRHRLAVRPFGIRVEIECRLPAIGPDVDDFGQQPIEREGLVGVALHQRLEDQIAEDRVDHAARGGAQALDDERVEVVEAADHAIGDAAALRGVRIDVGEMREVGRQRRFALHGDGMHRLRTGRQRGCQQRWLRRRRASKNHAAHTGIPRSRLFD